MTVTKILLPTDFSECANAALTEAIFLASQNDAELHLLHVVVLHEDDPFNPEHHFPNTDEIFKHLSEVAMSEMGGLLTEEQGQRLRIRQHQVRAISAAPAIIEFAAREQVDLIVMGGHGRRGLRRFILGSVAEEVVRESACPVLTLRHPQQRDPLQAVGTIMAPVDFSADSAYARGVARRLAPMYQAKLEVVHAVEELAALYPYDVVDTSMPQLVTKVEEALARFVADEGGAEVDIRLRVLTGSPARVITEHANTIEAGLIVLATHGLSDLERFLLGSVTERVVRMAECPVLTLKRPAGEDED